MPELAGEQFVVAPTALDLEYQAVRAHLTDVSRDSGVGTVFRIGSLSGAGLRIVLASTGDGNLGAAAITSATWWSRTVSPPAAARTGRQLPGPAPQFEASDERSGFTTTWLGNHHGGDPAPMGRCTLQGALQADNSGEAVSASQTGRSLNALAFTTTTPPRSRWRTPARWSPRT